MWLIQEAKEVNRLTSMRFTQQKANPKEVLVFLPEVLLTLPHRLDIRTQGRFQGLRRLMRMRIYTPMHKLKLQHKHVPRWNAIESWRNRLRCIVTAMCVS